MSDKKSPSIHLNLSKPTEANEDSSKRDYDLSGLSGLEESSEDASREELESSTDTNTTPQVTFHLDPKALETSTHASEPESKAGDDSSTEDRSPAQNRLRTSAASPTAKILPIIIVPGFMGTRLQRKDNHQNVWNPTAYDITSIQAGQSKAAAKRDELSQIGLAMEPCTTADIASGRKSRDGDHWSTIAKEVNGLGSCIMDFYGELARSLWHKGYGDEVKKQHGFTPKVYVFGYDWRQCNSVSAAKLATRIHEIQAETKADKVLLIAHSNGGILTRYYCNTWWTTTVNGSTRNVFGESQVRGLILIGHPSIGAPKAYEMLKTGLPWREVEVRLALAFDTWGSALGSSVYRDLARSMPTVYQFLPTNEFAQKHPGWLTFTPSQWEAFQVIKPSASLPDWGLYADQHTGFFDRYVGGGPYIPNPLDPDDNAVMRGLESRLAVNAVISRYSHPATYVIRTDTVGSTPGNYRLSGTDGVFSLELTSMMNGDGTVPSYSAECPTVSAKAVHYGSGSHVDMCNNSSNISIVKTCIGEILKSKSSKPAPAPATNNYPRAIQSAVEWKDGLVYLFFGDQCMQYDTRARKIVEGYPKKTKDCLPNLKLDVCSDAALNKGGGIVYFFSKSKYLRYNLNTNATEKNLQEIAPGWTTIPLANGGIDAALNWGDGYAYFFVKDLYYKIDLIKLDNVDIDKSARSVVKNWPNLWTDGIDAAFNDGSYAYLFKGEWYVKWKLTSDYMESGFPKKIPADWKNL